MLAFLKKSRPATRWRHRRMHLNSCLVCGGQREGLGYKGVGKELSTRNHETFFLAEQRKQKSRQNVCVYVCMGVCMCLNAFFLQFLQGQSFFFSSWVCAYVARVACSIMPNSNNCAERESASFFILISFHHTFLPIHLFGFLLFSVEHGSFISYWFGDIPPRLYV